MSGTFSVPGKYELTIDIDGVPPDPSRFNLGYIRILESIVYPLPVGTILILTDDQFWNETPIRENSQVAITFTPLASFASETETWGFRVFSVNQKYQAPYRIFRITLITDSPTMFDCHPRTVQGTSSDVFNLLATENDLFPDIDDSDDEQLWQQANRRNVIWARDVCDHAYTSDTSHYVWCNTRDNYMTFANLDVRKFNEPAWIMSPPIMNGTLVGGNVMFYDQIETKIDSGISNRAIAYGTKNVTTAFDTGQWVTFNPNAFNPLAPDQMYDHAETGTINRFFSLAPNIGNDHTYYNDAAVQNPRLRALYSVKVRVGTPFPLNASLIDTVDFRYANNYDQALDPVYSGAYIITQVDTRIGGDTMYRFFELTSDGVNFANYTSGGL